MQQENGYRTGSRSAYRRSRRKMRQLRNRIIVGVLLALIYIAWVCIIEIDKTCGAAAVHGLPDLPAPQAMTPPAVQIEPEIPIYDIPLSEDLQRYTFEKCVQYDVDHVMVLAIIQQESDYQPDLIDAGNYGLMQINRSNHRYLKDALGTTDFLDPEQNIEAGIFWLSGICENNTDPERILMVYNMGGSIAQDLWDMGRYSTSYSRGVMMAMDEIRGKQVSL
jgi:hypothetical protein